MAKFITSKNAQKYVEMLEKLCEKGQVELDMKTAIYPAAGLVAEAVQKNIKKLPIVNDNARGTPSNPIDGVTQWQRKGLEEGFGIAKFQNTDNFINVKLGFDGYNSTKGKFNTKWGNGHQPNVLIARSVESGNSFRKKHPFVAPAVRQTRAKAEQKMSDEMDRIIIEKGFDAL